MKVKTVTRYKNPGYPVKEEILADPQLLRRIPSRWEKNAYVMTALGLTVSLSACGASAEGAQGASDRVAPVFIHGGGSGAYGCVAVVSPYFLSEEEAFEIIRAEAESYGGLILTQEAAPELKNVKLPVTHIYPESEKTKEKTVKGSLQTDGWDPDKKIAIEFVSKSDVGNWNETEEGVYATVEGYAIQDTAVRLQKSLEKASPEEVVGIFYDPYDYGDLIEEYNKIQKKYEDREGNYWAAMSEEQDEMARAAAEENLKAQVRDFIDWLKGQGVI